MTVQLIMDVGFWQAGRVAVCCLQAAIKCSYDVWTAIISLRTT